MSRIAMIVCAAALAVAVAVLATNVSPGHAGDFRHYNNAMRCNSAIRYGHTSGWLYDNRDDHRDFPSNGVFPGNFAAQPYVAWIGAGGIAGSTPGRSAAPYPSQVVFGAIDSRRHPHQWLRPVTSSRGR